MSILNRKEWLDQIAVEAAEKGLDYHRLVVAKNNDIEYDAVTTTQREAMKVILFGYNYGSIGGISRLLKP